MYAIVFTNLSDEPKIGEIVKDEYNGEMIDFIKTKDGSYIYDFPKYKKVETYEEALKVKEDYEALRKEFDYNYLKYEWIKQHRDELLKLKKELDKLVEKYENLVGYDFCDVSAGGVQVRLKHKEIKNYTFGRQITIKYDCSNINEVLDLVEKAWVEDDTEENVNFDKRMIADCEKWGWH